ncbi:MAG: hypothetical protein Kow00123_01730 [Anaerolineales bacterium]
MRAGSFLPRVILAGLSILLMGIAPGATAQPPQPVSSAMGDVELVSQIGGPTSAVAIQGNYAYVAVGPRLVILNIANPASPTVAGQTGVLPRPIQNVAVAGNYAYVVAWVTDRDVFYVINVSNPAAPTQVGLYDAPGGKVRGVAAAGNYVYLAAGPRLKAISVANPAAPTLAGCYDLPGDG